MLRLRFPIVLVVLAFFLANVAARAAVPPAVAAGGGDHAALSFPGPGGGDPCQAPGGDGRSCNHGCHLLQHFQAEVGGSAAVTIERCPVAYAAAEPGAPPQAFPDTRLRPPRASVRSI